MGKPSPPKPPDPQKTAAAQTGTNVGTAIANQFLGNVNQVTPYGSLTYEQTGTYDWTDPQSGNTYTLPQYTATQELSRDQQRLHDTNALTQKHLAETGRKVSYDLRQHMDRGLSFNKAAAAGDIDQLRGAQPDLDKVGYAGRIRRGYTDDFSADRQRVEDTLMGQLNEQLDQDRASMETRLTQQGLEPGTEAWDRAMASHNDASQQARSQAILSAGQEQSRLAELSRQQAMFQNTAQQQRFDQSLRSTGFNNQTEQAGFQNEASLYDMQNQARQRDIQEMMMLRNQPINEVSALMSGSQVQSPNFMGISGTQMPTVDYAGIVGNNYNQQMANYNAQMGGYNNLVGALGGLGSAFLM